MAEDRQYGRRPPRAEHICPCGCGSQVPNRLLACKPGWFRLPSHIRRMFDHGQGRRSPAQMDAVTTAYEWYADNPTEV